MHHFFGTLMFGDDSERIYTKSGRTEEISAARMHHHQQVGVRTTVEEMHKDVCNVVCAFPTLRWLQIMGSCDWISFLSS